MYPSSPTIRQATIVMVLVEVAVKDLTGADGVLVALETSMSAAGGL